MRSFWPVVLLLLLPACKDDPPPPKPVDAGPPPIAFTSRVVPRSPLVVELPQDWLIDELDTGPAPPAPASEDGPLLLRSRILFSARASTTPGAPWVIVMHDPYLPKAATATDYLDAQRASNRQTQASLRHVDAERSTLFERPVYRVRDEWLATVGSKDISFAQEALLIVDQKSSPGERHGYAVVLTRMREDALREPDLGRRILDAVRFR